MVVEVLEEEVVIYLPTLMTMMSTVIILEPVMMVTDHLLRVLKPFISSISFCSL